MISYGVYEASILFYSSKNNQEKRTPGEAAGCRICLKYLVIQFEYRLNEIMKSYYSYIEYSIVSFSKASLGVF